MMSIVAEHKTTFYKAGGNLDPNAGCYVVRPADDDLFDAIRAGQYCFVLTSRQMGKSSLMHRTAVRLKDVGVIPIIVDLTGIGTNFTIEQWYFGLLAEIAAQLSLTAAITKYWDENERHGPLYRFTHALAIILSAVPDADIAIFIDEIVLSAAFQHSPQTNFLRRYAIAIISASRCR